MAKEPFGLETHKPYHISAHKMGVTGVMGRVLGGLNQLFLKLFLEEGRGT